MLTLKELVNRCVDKDKSAWNEFVFRFKAIVEKAIRTRFSRHNLSHRVEDIKDITQGIFLDIWEKNKLELVKDEDRLSGWLVIVAQNAAIDFIRAQAKFSRQRSIFIDNGGEPQDIAAVLPSQVNNPVDELIQNDLVNILDILVDALEAKEKLILKLNIQYNLTHREIADLMKISINTISSILRRTLRRFRESLQKRGYTDI